MKRLLYLVRFALLVFGLLYAPVVFSQNPKIDISTITREEIDKLNYDDLLNMPFEDLMVLASKIGVSVDDLLNMKLQISKQAMPIREQPNIVSVITDEDIENSDATDLIEILQTVPGFHFNFDSEGVIGMSNRGNFVHEGKFLLLIDGHEMNEQFYSTLQFENHYPIQQIKRIEIIRGPGSAIYGGCAELGVINIITKSGEDMSGFNFTTTYSRMKETYGRRNLAFSGGGAGKDFGFAIHGFAGDKYRSELVFTNFGNLTDSLYKGHATNNNEYININLNYKQLKATIIYDNWFGDAIEGDSAEPDYYKNRFKSYLGEVKYEYSPNVKLTVVPHISYKLQEPWCANEWLLYNKQISRTTAGLFAIYQATNNINIVSGADYYFDRGRLLKDDPDTFLLFYNNKSIIDLHTFAGYAQANFRSKIANITLGSHIEHNNIYGLAFAPRIGINKIFNNFHIKLLYGRAYRSPNIGNIRFNQNLKPETTDVVEMEAGYKINNNMYLTANLYNINLNKIIVWYEGDSSGYDNFGKSGTKGIETEFCMKYEIASMVLNYSYYTAEGKDKNIMYEVPENQTQQVGIPQHKVAARIHFQLSRNIALNSSFVYKSGCYGYTSVDTSGIALIGKIPKTLVINAYLQFSNVLVDGFSVGFGCYNILDQNYQYVQAYNGYKPPFPSSSREFLFKLIYDVNFND